MMNEVDVGGEMHIMPSPSESCKQVFSLHVVSLPSMFIPCSSPALSEMAGMGVEKRLPLTA